ncbi:dihydroxyacetone kinase [Paenibacillus sp. FSL R7-277]|uniref:dihydroxyacetone kinase subunit DhaK n=1 Tax=Paenibacillus sp. FSL R7-277 TaxID=1227352 RepID=UPI0003E20EDC|nr:dihydroxyacetone kinase subunit DhaK [Paenibacillus sp. FSL R7-277]ETT77164.1 dihydroxyacetone kinase [Paenibacillus sp. FSL R7-277]
MKKIINDPANLVREMCSGLVMAHPQLTFDSKYKIVSRSAPNPDKVTLISGGGSGHEPAHAGLVGPGMLDAAVCGDVFASPSQIQVYQAIRNHTGHKGALLIIKNYSGDMMNFQNAACLAAEDGLSVDYVKVDDDIAVEDSLYTVGRRGVAGTILVHKVAGAAAEAGLPLAEVKQAAQHAAEHVRSLGFAFTSCTVPAKGTPTFQLQEDEMEYGVGIHGEPGIRREKLLTADELAERMISALLASLNLDQPDGGEVVVLVNGFGATPLQELYLLNHSVIRSLGERGIIIRQSLVGNYMTSIDMAGASISLMKLDDELRRWLAEPCDTPALRLTGELAPVQYVSPLPQHEAQAEVSLTAETDPGFAVLRDERLQLDNIIYLVDKMSEIIIANEAPFCELDAHAGDGDFGMSVAKGFKQLKREWKELVQDHATDIGSFLQACSLIIMEHCGGASGPIWGSAFRSAGKYATGRTSLNTLEMAGMLDAAAQGIQATGERSFGRGAVVGDKTLIDALIPCAEAWKSSAQQQLSLKEAFARGAEAAVTGAERTKSIVARMGRAGTVGERSIGHPDAGAFALGVIFTELSNAVQ